MDIAKKDYRICKRCVMDTSASEITFNEKGICNFCTDFDKLAEKTIWRAPEVKLKELSDSVAKLKELGKNDKYDCLIGLSGGVDSSYLCYWAKQEDLRPLVVHFDNGWNSELASQNIERIIQKTGFDLYTYVINWEEFKDLQLAYLKAGVIDLEVPTDQLIFAAIDKIAKKYRIKTLVKGHNTASEAILPRSWIQPDKFDMQNLLDIHRKFGKVELRDFPKIDLITQTFNQTFHKMYSIWPLDLLQYDKQKAKQLLINEFGWRDYGGKHYESVFTRFYQGYILPRRFNVDKRRAHLSNLIADGVMKREEALTELDRPTYDPQLQEQDYNYVIKKFGITVEEFENFMNAPIVSHNFYETQWDKKHFRKYYIFKTLILPFLKIAARFKK
jgi:N-acetyl sugar amidotransferase